MSIDIVRIDVGFGGRPALRAISGNLQPGRITAVVGPNAAGKTTLLRCVAGVLGPDQGEIRLDDESIQSLSAAGRSRRIAYLGQRSTVAGGFTAGEVVAFGGLGRRRDPARVPDVLAEVGLETEVDRSFQTLSAGQQQRVALARAIYQAETATPGWLVLDEPFAAQDPKEVARILSRLAAWRAAGHGALIAIHDLRVARAIADQAFLLKDGRLVGAGDAAEVLTAARLGELFEVDFDDTPAGPIARWTATDGASE